MAVLNDLQSYLEKSIDTPLLQADPAYIAVKADIPNILTQIIREAGYSVAELPIEEERLVLLLARKELYFRLATTQAPHYDAETEFGKVLKGKRFDHYIKLVEFALKDIEELRQSGQLANVKVANVVLRSRDGSARNYELSLSQTNVSVTASNPTASTFDLDWTMFNTSKGSFYCYDVLIGTTPMYDPYEIESIMYKDAVQNMRFFDIHRTQLRIKNLTSNTKYYVALVMKSADGNVTVAETEITTAI
jgi:hypothetical protein